ncbi:retrovirus-related pol polyprotein from transposon TNT 1-94, partial [Tanacetum coccineum]
SSKTSDSNTPVFPSIGLKSSTSASRSHPTSNKKNDRISQIPSSNIKNKVEAYPRRVNLNSNKKNHVKDPICDANGKHTMLNANSELICVKCKQCMFDANHDVCFFDFVNAVNVRSKSMSAKNKKKQNIWKPTGHMFTEIGYKWKSIGRLFILVGNSCPLTRITPTKVVSIKESTSHSVETQQPELKVYSRKPKQGSNATDVPSSSSLVNDRLSRLFSASKTKSWLWQYRLSHLNFGTLNKLAKDGLARGIPKLKIKKDHLCSACALGKSKKSSHQLKAEDTNKEKLYLLHMDLCDPIHVESINGKSISFSRPGLQSMTPVTSSSGLVSNLVPQQPFNPPTRNDWDCLFQPMFDEYFNPPQSTFSPVPVAVAPRAVDIAGSPSSTTIDLDAPSSSTSSTNQQQQSSIISQGVEESIPNVLFVDPCHEPLHDVSNSQESSSNVQSSHSLLELIGKWTKDHPLPNVIGNPSRQVSTRRL